MVWINKGVTMSGFYKKKEQPQSSSSGRVSPEPHPDAEKNFAYFKKKLEEYNLHKIIDIKYEKSIERPVFNEKNNKHEYITEIIEPVYVMFSWQSEGRKWFDVFSLHDHWHGNFCEACDDLFDSMERKRMASRKGRSMDELRNGW